MKSVALLFVLASSFCLADSVPFVYQNSGFTSVSLASSPTVDPTFGAHMGNAHLEFGMDLAPTSQAVVIFSMTLDGKTYTDFVSVSCLSGCTVIDGFAIPNFIKSDTPATLTITVNGQSVTETFTERAIIPEPSTWALMLTGMLGLFLVRRFARA